MFSSMFLGFLTGIALFILIRLISTVVKMWIVNGITILPHLIVLIFLLVLASCTKDPVYPDVCIDGNCDARLVIDHPLDENGFYHVDLSNSTRFNVEIIADNINDYWKYGGRPVAFARFHSDASRIIMGDEVKLVQETEIYLSELDSNTLYGKRIIGPVVDQFIGDTITVKAVVKWDGGVKLFEVYEKTLKFILE